VRGHLRARGPNRWGIVIELGRDASGRRQQAYHTVHGSKRAAEAELRRRLHELETGLYADPGKLSTGDYLRRWLQDAARMKVSPKTYERYEEITEKHLIPHLGHHPLAKLAPLHIQRYYAAALVSGRRDGKGGLSPTTVRHHHAVLHAALTQAVQWRLLTLNPAEHVELPRIPHREEKRLDAEVVSKLLAAARGHRLQVPVLLAMGTGLRQGEICGLRWSDIDLDRGVLEVRQSLEQLHGGRLRFKEPKNRKRRSFGIGAVLLGELRAHQEVQQLKKLDAGPLWQESGLVITTDLGEPVPPSRISERFRWLAEKCGHPEITFHDLRHAAATHLLARGADVASVSQRLGHSRHSTTMDVYGHAIKTGQDRTSELADQILGDLLPESG
jgi:integrase